MPLPPEHVLSAFHAETGATGSRRAQGDQLGPVWDNGIKVGDVVYSQAGPFAAWSAKVRERLSVPGARVSRPVLASDGRHTAAGWKATQFLPGEVTGRIDEAAQTALRLDDAMANAPAPLGAHRDDAFARAERTAWAETGEAYDKAALADVPLVTAHTALLTTTVFYGAHPPGIVDLVPSQSARPAGWGAALVIVDGLIAQVVDDDICQRFGHVPGMQELLLRAVSYRRHINDLNPRSRSNVRSNIERVEQFLVSRASAILGR